MAGEHPPIPGVDQLETPAIGIRAGAVTRLHGQEAEPSGRVSCLCVRGHARNQCNNLATLACSRGRSPTTQQLHEKAVASPQPPTVPPATRQAFGLGPDQPWGQGAEQFDAEGVGWNAEARHGRAAEVVTIGPRERSGRWIIEPSRSESKTKATVGGAGLLDRHRRSQTRRQRSASPPLARASFGPEDCDPLQDEAEAEESQADALPVCRLPGLPGCVAQNLLPLHRIISEKRRCRRHGRWCIAGGDEDQGSDHARHRRGERQPIAGGQIESPHDRAPAAA